MIPEAPEYRAMGKVSAAVGPDAPGRANASAWPAGTAIHPPGPDPVCLPNGACRFPARADHRAVERAADLTDRGRHALRRAGLYGLCSEAARGGAATAAAGVQAWPGRGRVLRGGRAAERRGVQHGAWRRLAAGGAGLRQGELRHWTDFAERAAGLAAVVIGGHRRLVYGSGQYRSDRVVGNNATGPPGRSRAGPLIPGPPVLPAECSWYRPRRSRRPGNKSARPRPPHRSASRLPGWRAGSSPRRAAR